MALAHAEPGEVVDLRPLAAALETSKTHTLIKTPAVEVVRLVMPAGKEIPAHQAPGILIVQCLEGQVDFTALGKTTRLEAGQLLYLAGQEPHALRCVQNASLLLTILFGQ